MSAVGGRTTASRIRTSRPGGGSARCSASRARAQRKDFSPLTLPSSTPSTSNATSLPLQRIALCAPRRSARGARQLRPLKISRAAGPSRSFVGNVTRPSRFLRRPSGGNKGLKRVFYQSVRGGPHGGGKDYFLQSCLLCGQSV